VWRRAAKKVGIDNLRFHDLRHEATSRFFEKGLNVMKVAAITGHKDLRMLQRYTHLRTEDLAKKLG
jgi:integrase